VVGKAGYAAEGSRACVGVSRRICQRKCECRTEKDSTKHLGDDTRLSYLAQPNAQDLGHNDNDTCDEDM